MYATVHAHPHRLSADRDPSAVARAVLPAGQQPAGLLVVDHLEEPAATVVAAWPGDAPSTGEASVHQVVDRLAGAATGRLPLFAQLTWLNGAGDPAVAQAAERAGRERIHPAVADLDGLVDVLVLRSTTHQLLVVATATALETFREMQHRIMSTRLLPGEDPRLLPGPDRLQLGRVLLAQLPVRATS